MAQTLALQPTETPGLIGILAVGATLIGRLLTLLREARAQYQDLRAELRAENRNLQSEVRAGLADIRTDVRALTGRMVRIQGAIERVYARRNRANGTA